MPAPTSPTVVIVVAPDDWMTAVSSAPVTAPDAALVVKRARNRRNMPPARLRNPLVSMRSDSA